MNPSGTHVASADRPARTADADELSRRARLVRREHRTVDREDRVELPVGEGNRLGVALTQVDGDALGLGAPASAFEEVRHVVDADDLAPAAGGRESGVPAAARDVEHAPARLEVGGLADLIGHRLDHEGHGMEVAAGPHLLLAALDGGQVGRLRGHPHSSGRVHTRRRRGLIASGSRDRLRRR